MELNHALAGQAFETVIRAQEASSIDELNQVIAPAIEALGFKHFVAVKCIGAGKQRRVRVLHGINDAAWQAHYLGHGLGRYDPGVSEAGQTIEPFFRSELAARRGGLTRSEQRVLEDGRSFGVRDTLFSPQHHVDGSLGAVVFTAWDPPETGRWVRAAAHLIAIHYFPLACRLLHADGRRSCLSPHAALSRRQLECLKWVRAGKSSPEIGDIMNLSGRTVDAYIAAACERLGVRTRIQAVATALIEGLLWA